MVALPPGVSVAAIHLRRFTNSIGKLNVHNYLYTQHCMAVMIVVIFQILFYMGHGARATKRHGPLLKYASG